MVTTVSKPHLGQNESFRNAKLTKTNREDPRDHSKHQGRTLKEGARHGTLGFNKLGPGM